MGGEVIWLPLLYLFVLIKTSTNKSPTHDVSTIKFIRIEF